MTKTISGMFMKKSVTFLKEVPLRKRFSTLCVMWPIMKQHVFDILVASINIYYLATLNFYIILIPKRFLPIHTFVESANDDIRM